MTIVESVGWVLLHFVCMVVTLWRGACSVDPGAARLRYASVLSLD